jgi:glycosyltransferase involved in cell wall biosynthesis
MEHATSTTIPRIALISGSLNLGGTTTFLCNFAGELVRRKIPVEILSFEKQNPLASDFSRQNIPVLALDQQKIIFEDRLQHVLEGLKRFQPTAVLATLSATSFEPLRYVPKGILRVGVAQSDDPGVYEMIGRYAPWLDTAAMVSQTMKRKAEGIPAFSNVPVAYLPYGVPMPAEVSSRDFQQPLRILYFGRLYRDQKRVHLFPTILKQLQASGIPFHWTVAGEGVEREALERTMKSNRADQTVSFPGQISYRDVTQTLLNHDVFLLASDYEGLPLSLLEAMGCGVVPVVSNLPSGIPEVVNEATGKLVQPDNVSGYAEAIIALHNDRPELARLSSAAREKVLKDFSIGAMTDRWLSHLTPKEATNVHWPDAWKIQSPFATRHPLYFSRPIRMLRRMAIRFR